MIFGDNLYRANDSKKRLWVTGREVLNRPVGWTSENASLLPGWEETARTAGNNEENSDGLPSTSHAVVMAVSHEAHTSAMLSASFHLSSYYH
jgi:hypothetical protein